MSEQNATTDLDYSTYRNQMLPRIDRALDRISEGVRLNKNIDYQLSNLFTGTLRHVSSLLGIMFPPAPFDDTQTLISLLDRVTEKGETTVLTATNQELLDLFGTLVELFIQAMRRAVEDEGLTEEGQRQVRFDLSRLQLAAQEAGLYQQAIRLSKASDQAESVVSHIEEVAGDAASAEIAKYYSEHAKAERNRYFFWTTMLLLTVATSVALVWFILSRIGNASASAQEIGRLAFVIPILALAAYAGRQAGYHRNAESTSRWISVQLKTVRAFADSLTAEARQEIMRQLGTKLFGSGEMNKNETEEQFGTANELVQALRDIISDRK